MTTISKDDPKLTAYVLGELDAQEAAAVEQAAESDPAIAAELDAIRAVCGELQSQYVQSGSLSLTHRQRTELESAMTRSMDLQVPKYEAGAAPTAMWTRSPDFWRGTAALSGMAALVAMGVFVPRMFFHSNRLDRTLAIEEPSQTAAPPEEAGLRDARLGGKQLNDELTANKQMASAMRRAVEELEARSDLDEMRTGYIVEGNVRTNSLKGSNSVDPSPSPLELFVNPNSAGTGGETESPQLAWMKGASDEEQPALTQRGRSMSRQETVTREMLRDQVATVGGKLARVAPSASAPASGGEDAMYQFEDAPALEFGGLLDEGPRTQTASAPEPIVHNPFVPLTENPLSTFSIDVDTASYSNLRGLLREGQLPPASFVRVEEMVNYFDYDYTAPSPGDDHPFVTNAEVAPCPWADGHRLVRLGIKGMEIPRDDRPATNLVFLVDVSGSMQDRNKLPLVKEGLKLMVSNLTVDDRVALVTYAGNAGVVLDSTSCFHRDEILAAIDNLSAGGSTHGSQGIQRAYEIAVDHFIEGGMNRVVLATDGDFNVGITNNDELVGLIQEKAASGVFLNVLGFGHGNLKDARLEQLADKGNGMYAYIDDIHEARKAFVDRMSGTLVTIAKDVKIQVEFNPQAVQSYRLIGYENRMLPARDFNDDTKDAGEIGAGHTVTALYEVVPSDERWLASLKEASADRADENSEAPGTDSDLSNEGVDPLRYVNGEGADEWLTVKLRYKQPDGDESTLVQYPITAQDALRHESFGQASTDFRFATSVAAMGQILRGSPYVGETSLSTVLGWAQEAIGEDVHGDRREFVEVVRKARELKEQPRSE